MIVWAGYVPGQGSIATWAVNDLCNHVRIRFRSGKMREFVLKQYVFQNGDHSFHSMLAVGRHQLLVTHQHGAFLVNDQGRVVRELDERPPVDFDVRDGRVRRSKVNEGAFDTWLTAGGWNGRTILATGYDAGVGYVTLMTPELRRTKAFEFEPGSRVTQVRAEGINGWVLEVREKSREEVWRLSNAGNLRRVSSRPVFPKPRLEFVGDTVRLLLDGRAVWSDSTMGTASLDTWAGGRIVVRREHLGFDVFNAYGKLLWGNSFPADRDPRPWLLKGRSLVWGEGVYNVLDGRSASERRWHEATRRFYAMDLRDGRRVALGGVVTVGYPVAVGAREVACLNVRGNQVVLEARSLLTGALRRRKVVKVSREAAEQAIWRSDRVAPISGAVIARICRGFLR